MEDSRDNNGIGDVACVQIYYIQQQQFDTKVPGNERDELSKNIYNTTLYWQTEGLGVKQRKK